MGSRMLPGSLPIHDLKKAHNALVRDGGLESEATGRRERPGLPRADGDGERPVLLAQALPLALHGNAAAEPAGLPRLVRLALPGQSGQGQMGPDRKGGASYPDDGRDLPQLGVGAVSRVI